MRMLAGMDVRDIGETACIALPSMREVPMVNCTVGLDEDEPAGDATLDAIADFYAAYRARSYRNILGSRFEEAYVRENYLSPDAAIAVS